MHYMQRCYSSKKERKEEEEEEEDDDMFLWLIKKSFGELIFI